MSDVLSRLAEENPNIGQQLHDWQVARTQANEDAYDWSNFRSHALALGAPDPGEDEPGEFREYNWTLYVPQKPEEHSEAPKYQEAEKKGFLDFLLRRK
jgi:hypothetical protein